MLRQKAEELPDNPQTGRLLVNLGPREIRQIVVSEYVMRYEVRRDEIIILHIWHGNEDWPYQD